MKKILILTLTLCPILTFSQTIFRVNNLPGVTGVNLYTTIQDAHDAASDGDIIYVEPSLVTYGVLICTKRLILLGNGYFHFQNENDSYETKQSILERIVFDIGSDSSVVRGLTITSQGGLHGSSIEGEGVKKIEISNCRIFGTIFLDYYYDYELNINKRCSGWIITHNFCKGINATGGTQEPHPINLVISNNLLEFTYNIGGGSLIYNNTFYRFGGLGTIYGSEVFNNIIQSTPCDNCPPITVLNIPSENTNVYNNIMIYDDQDLGYTAQYELPSVNGNINGILKNTVFVLEEPDNSFTSSWADKNYILNSTSPAKGIGVNGEDAGAFGGVNPYVLAGQIPYPIITDFKSTGAGNSSVPLQVNITVKGNN